MVGRLGFNIKKLFLERSRLSSSSRQNRVLRGAICTYGDEQAEVLTKKLTKSVLAKSVGESDRQVITSRF